jgi:hypothetical protein
MIKEQCQEQNCLFQQVNYRNKCHSPEKLSWVRVSMKMFDLGLIAIITISVIFNYAYRSIRPIVNFRIIKIDKKHKHCSNNAGALLAEI